MSTLAEAVTELGDRGFAEIPPARRVTFLNQAKDQFEDAYPFPWLETTVTGPAPLTIEGLKAVLYVVDTTNEAELVGVPAQQIIATVDAVIGRAGAPQVWWLDGEETLKTWPTNSAVLSVRCLAQSPPLEDDGDEPLIPARYHPTWVDLAAVRCHIDTSSFEAAASLRGVAGMDLAQVINRYETRNRQNGSYQTLTEGY